MANEINAYTKFPEPHGARKWVLIYLYDISGARITDNAGNDLVVQSVPASGPAAQVLSQAQKDAIAAGDALWEQIEEKQSAGESDAAFVARVRADYAAREAWFVQKVRDQYESVGQQVDA